MWFPNKISVASFISIWHNFIYVNFNIIDGFEKVTDKDAALYTRKLARLEGIFAGNSCGAAIKGLLQLEKKFNSNDVIVVLLHDSGSRYIGKIYNDDWMRKKKFM